MVETRFVKTIGAESQWTEGVRQHDVPGHLACPPANKTVYLNRKNGAY